MTQAEYELNDAYAEYAFETRANGIRTMSYDEWLAYRKAIAEVVEKMYGEGR